MAKGLTARQQDDGRWTIERALILPEHPVVFEAEDGKESSFWVGEKWLGHALETNQTRRAQDDYRGPLHENHHGRDEEVKYQGRFELTELAPSSYQGEIQQGIYGDLVDIDAETLGRIERGELSYLSPEILSFQAAEIDSVALLSHAPPHFRLEIKIGEKIPNPSASRRRPGAVSGRPEPVAVYQAIARDGGAIRYQRSAGMAHGIKPIRMQEPDEELLDDELEVGLEDEAPEALPPDDTPAEIPAELEEVAEPPVDLSNIDPIEPEVDMGDEDEDEEEDEGAMRMLRGMARLDAVGAYSASDLTAGVKALYKQNQKLIRQNARQQAQLDQISADRSRGSALKRVASDLALYGVDYTEAMEKGGAMYAAGGIPALTAYHETRKEAAQSSGLPPTSWDDSPGAAQSDLADLGAQYQASPELMKKGRQYAAQYRELEAGGIAPRIGLVKFVEQQMKKNTNRQEA